MAAWSHFVDSLPGSWGWLCIALALLGFVLWSRGYQVYRRRFTPLGGAILLALGLLDILVSWIRHSR